MTASDLAHVRPWRMIQRRVSRKIRVGSVEVGGDAPITVQTMTNTVTADAGATIDQIRRIEEASKYVPIENLSLSPQCGFASVDQGNLISWDDQKRKLELVVSTARKVWG